MITENKILQIEEISFGYNRNETILDDFSIDVNEGEFVTVLGDSGVGKTTLFRAINGLEKIENGYIRVDGNLMSSSFYHLPPEKRPVGTIFQDYALFPHFNVEKNIYYGIDKKNFDKKFVDEIVNLLRVENLFDRYIDQLSGGQRQRVSLARSLVRKPKLLLMDEPYSNLDKNLRQDIRRDLKKIFSKMGSTVLLITHDSEEALSLSDKIGYLYKGKIIQFDTPYEIFHNPLHKIIAKSISNSNILEGTPSNGKIRTNIGEFITSEKITNPDKISINVRPNQLTLDNSSKKYEIVEEEFLEGSQLYLVKDTENNHIISVSMIGENDFSVGDKVGIQIINNNANLIDIS